MSERERSGQQGRTEGPGTEGQSLRSGTRPGVLPEDCGDPRKRDDASRALCAGVVVAMRAKRRECSVFGWVAHA